MRVQVTQDDIAHGTRKNACKCPVARALMRQTANSFWSVSPSRMSCDNRHYTSPKSVVQFIHDFDRGRPVKPFEFELDCDGGKPCS